MSIAYLNNLFNIHDLMIVRIIQFLHCRQERLSNWQMQLTFSLRVNKTSKMVAIAYEFEFRDLLSFVFA